jgi:PEP-CTERM motif-containing protein
MRIVSLVLVFAAAALIAPLAQADATVNMVFVGVNGVNDGQFYVSPYNGTMNGQGVTLFCDDVINEVTFWQTWTANLTNLASDDFSNTRYGTFVPTGVTDVHVLYEKAAWLTTQFASHPLDYVNLQYALWDLMNPGTYSGTGVQGWLDQAATNYGTIDPGNFAVVTNLGPLALRGQVQEFIVQTPEPGTLLLLLCGLGTMTLLARRHAPGA